MGLEYLRGKRPAWKERRQNLSFPHTRLAQLGERRSYKSEVVGSKPTPGTQVKVTERIGCGLQNRNTLVRIQSLTLPFPRKKEVTHGSN